MRLYVTKLHLSNAADEALMASCAISDPIRAHHVDHMKSKVVMALAGCEAGAPIEKCRAELLQVIEGAITDSHDLDSTDRDAANAVLAALLDNIAPMPATDAIAAE